MHKPFYNFQKVLDAIYPSIDQFVKEIFPEARKAPGCYRVGSLDGDRGRSLSISTRPNNAGCYTDHSDASIKGNAISLVASTKGMSYEDAGEWLAKFLNVQPETRMYMPKKRPAPIIKKESIQKLNQKSIDYAKTRGIHEDTLRKAKCASTDTHIVFPHFDESGKLVLLKYWSCDGLKNMFSNENPIPVLFAKEIIDPVKTGGMIIICEGQWDALTWIQLGYPAVSIPSGVSNDEWISEDWSFLNNFSDIYLDFDDDPPGREAELKAKVRLGYERCRSVKYRFKDANEALQAGEPDVLHDAIKAAMEAPVERVMKPEEMRSKVKDSLNKTNVKMGIPFFLPKMNINFRPHEMTMWFGHTSHGKSSIVSNQICYAASLGEMCMVASFEQTTVMTLAAMLTQYTADPDIGRMTHFDEAYDDLASRVLFFDSMSRTNPDELIATIIQAHKQLGVCTFVVDNIMTLDVDRQDNTAQASVADKFRVLVATYPIHLHLVAHPRKPMDNTTKPPAIAEIRGASEWGDMPHNIIVIHRDVVKAENIAQMVDDGKDYMDIMAYDDSIPDGKAIVRKQRDSGDLPMTTYKYNKLTKRAWRDPEDLVPYWTPNELEEKAEE